MYKIKSYSILFLQICCLLASNFYFPMTSIGQVDRKATKETRALYQHLFDLRTKGVMFGHQDALAYGLNADLTRWIGGVNHSDIMTITGAHPAVVGHDLGHLELG